MPPKDQVQKELENILHSRHFNGALRPAQFLKAVVAAALEGNTLDRKDITEKLQLSDPERVGPIAQRTKQRLGQYYVQHPNAPFEIRIAKRGYGIDFSDRQPAAAPYRERSTEELAINDRVRAALLAQYYGSTSDPSVRRYGIVVDGVPRGTSVFTSGERVGMKVALGSVSCRHEHDPKVLPPAPPLIEQYAEKVRSGLANVKLEDNPLYRLLSVTFRGPFAAEFAEDSYCNYRFTSGLLEDELADFISKPDTRGLLKEHCPVRNVVMPDIERLLDCSSRCCAGGSGIVFALAKKRRISSYRLRIDL